MSRYRGELPLEDSWVVDGDEDDYNNGQETSSPFQSSFESQSSTATDGSATIKEGIYQSFSDPRYARAQRHDQRMPYQKPSVADEYGHSEDPFSSTSPKKRKLVQQEQHTQHSQQPFRDHHAPQQQFVMPALGETAMDGSWTDPARPPRPQRTPPGRQSHETEGTGARRRTVRPVPDNESPRRRIETRNNGRLEPLERAPHLPGPSPLQQLARHLADMALNVLAIIKGAFSLLRYPLSILLALWMLYGIGIFARHLVTSSIYSSLSPLCAVPGMSLLHLPFCPSGSGGISSKATAEFDKLADVQSLFEDVLDSSDAGVNLPMDMKRGESSIRDLRLLVQYSALHSKNELVLEFDGFIDSARTASYDLQKFNSRVGRAVDTVLSTTRWTTRVLEGIQDREAEEGVLSSWGAIILAPFQPVKFTERALLNQYITHTSIIEDEIQKLILEATALLGVLNNLEDRLEVIHSISTRDGMHALATRDELLSELWTFLGGNRHKISKTNRQLNLLKQVGLYRRSAWNHVSATIVKLQEIGTGLEDLRERVGGVETTGGRVPLSVHIENVKRGVERLEEKRGEQRRVEGEVRGRVLSGEEMGEEGRSLDAW